MASKEPVTSGVSKLKSKGPAKEAKEVRENDVNQNGDSEKSSSIHPLQITEVADLIISYCDIATLRSARLVCQLWNLKAIPYLYQLAYFSAPTKFYRKSKEDQKWAISHMKKFLSTHQLLIPHIGVFSERDVPTLCDFGDKDSNRCIGPFVTTLNYGIYDCVKPLENLLRRLKNLQYLDMRPLKSDTNLPLQFCRELITVCAKIHPRVITLTEFSMFVNLKEEPKYLDVFKCFSSLNNVRVQKLLFGIAPSTNFTPDIRVQLSEILSTMLEKNPYMTSLCTWGSEMYLTDAVLPKMPYLQLFHWSVFTPRPIQRPGGPVPAKYSFPPDFQLSDNFPSLINMGINYGYKENNGDRTKLKSIQFWDLYFAHQKPVLSLKTLSYSDHARDFNLDPILRCFPNLELFYFSNPGDFSLAAKSIFTHGKNLQTLLLNIDLDSLASPISSFDTIFTGFSEAMVKKIMNSPKTWNDSQIFGEETLDSLRVEPSLFDLPNLEVLSITIRGGSVNPLPRKIFTIAAKYGFSLLSKLQVEIYIEKGCHEQRTLDALKKVFKDFSNVTFSSN